LSANELEDKEDVVQELKWQERRHKAFLGARDLRDRSTAAEAALWRELRGRKLAGLKFRRRHPFV
jgi:very-short-patch-repair endonuclease